MKRISVEVFLSVGTNLERLQVTVAQMPNIKNKLTAEAGKQEILEFLDSDKRQVILGNDDKLMSLLKTDEGIIIHIIHDKMTQTADPIPGNVLRDHVENAPDLEAFLFMSR